MEESGEYRVTQHRYHQGRGPDSPDAKVIFSHRDEAPVTAYYRTCLPPLPGTVIAAWRPDGSLWIVCGKSCRIDRLHGNHDRKVFRTAFLSQSDFLFR
jgi:hypothetical protein